MAAAQYNITIESGATFELQFNWTGTATPVYLGIYQARFNLRNAKYSSPIFISSTQNGLAASTPATGSLYFSLTSQQTSSIPFKEGYYEVEIYNTTSTPYVNRLREGHVNIDRT